MAINVENLQLTGIILLFMKLPKENTGIIALIFFIFVFMNLFIFQTDVKYITALHIPFGRQHKSAK